MGSEYQYAGLRNPRSPGLPVEVCSARLHRLAHAESRLMFLEAAHVISTPGAGREGPAVPLPVRGRPARRPPPPQAHRAAGFPAAGVRGAGPRPRGPLRRGHALARNRGAAGRPGPGHQAGHGRGVPPLRAGDQRAGRLRQPAGPAGDRRRGGGGARPAARGVRRRRRVVGPVAGGRGGMVRAPAAAARGGRGHRRQRREAAGSAAHPAAAGPPTGFRVSRPGTTPSRGCGTSSTSARRRCPRAWRR